MDDMWTLLLLSLTMLIGCYLAGCIPLAITLSEEKLKLITVLGAGLLVGTALAVIIPEGVHTLYAKQEGHTHVHKEVESSVQKVAEKQGSEAEHTHIHSTELHTWIGVALVLGFIFMLLIDQLSGGSHSHVAGKSDTSGTAKDSADLEAGSRHSQNLLEFTVALVNVKNDSESAGSGKVPHRRNITATLGLVVHAAADGVALGAAATTSQTHVEMIVFIAIMLHKAPAAFGLVSFLLHAGFERNRIRKHLAAFSAAAPLLAVITYFGLSQQDKQILTDVNATGIAMLFSAGTFLYVATVHILPELASMGTSRTQAPDGTTIVREQKGFTKLELSVMIVGSLLPLVLSFGHHH